MHRCQAAWTAPGQGSGAVSIGLDKSNRRANVSHLPVTVLPAISSAGFELRQVAAHPARAAHYAVFVDRSKDFAQVVNTEIVPPPSLTPQLLAAVLLAARPGQPVALHRRNSRPTWPSAPKP